MSNFSLSFYLNAYSDGNPSNAPSMNNFKWLRTLNSIPANNPTSVAFQLAPGESRTLFSGSRTLTQDGTTDYSIQLKPLTTNTYVLSSSSGTAPNFRTPRTVGANATTEVDVTINGPVATFTSVTPSYAQFCGLVPGMLSSVTITANVAGTNGNSVLLVGNGSSTITQLIAAWNTANPSNTVTLTTGNGAQIPDGTGTYASFNGTLTGTSSAVTITANTIGTSGNSVVLTGNGSSSISALIAAWNSANPLNTVTLTSGDGTQVPSAGTAASYTGTPIGPTPSIITLTAHIPGLSGDSIILVGDGLSSVDTLVANWNISNPLNTVVLTSGIGTQVPNFGVLMALINGANPATADLSGGIAANILTLSGGSNGAPFNLISGGVVVGDYVRIGDELNSSLNVFSQANWGEYQIIAVTPTSFSVENLSGVAEGPITLGADFANQIQIYSAAGVQVGDTLVISGGFSLVTQGSYQITAVGAEFLEFYSTNVLPQQADVLTEDIAIYFMAKRFVYLESDQVCALTVNGSPSDTIQPFIILNCTQPGLFVRTSTVFSMAIVNNSATTANLFLATIE